MTAKQRRPFNSALCLKVIMEEILELENMLEELAEEVEPHLPLIPDFLSNLKNTDKPLSIFSMTSFFSKIESIRAGIYEVAKIEEYYSLNILFRALIEHFVKAQYIWMKTVENKDDEIGIDYWVFGQDKENIDYAKALQQSYSLVGITPDKKPTEILKEMGVISKEISISQINKKSDQFNYKNMTHFIADRLKTKDTASAPFLISIFPRYSELSSCVHGGPDSVKTYANGPEAVSEIIQMATFSTLYTRWLSMVLFYQYDKKFEKLCQISQKYLHEYVGHNKLFKSTPESGAI